MNGVRVCRHAMVCVRYGRRVTILTIDVKPYIQRQSILDQIFILVLVFSHVQCKIAAAALEVKHHSVCVLFLVVLVVS
jgi:hypothetical protein